MRRFEAGRESVNEDEKVPQASSEVRKVHLENDLERHETKLYHLDEDIVQAESRLKDLKRQRQGLVSHLDEVKRKLQDVTRLVELETEVASLRNQLAVQNGVKD